MLNIKNECIVGQKFKLKLSPHDWVCIGYGENPNGTPYIVGKIYDTAIDNSIIATHLFKDVEFIGKTPDPV